jgi:hypothetical protein
MMASGTQEHIYSIPFRSVEDFRTLWPMLRGLVTPGAPITLKQIGTAGAKMDDWHFTGPMVQIYAPSQGITGASPMRDNKGRAVSNERINLGMRMSAGETLTNEELAELDPDSLRGDGVMTIDSELLEEFEASGETLRADAPWPAYLYDENGALPEYVTSEEVDGKLRWTPSETFTGLRGFRYRSRVEIVLYVDGDVIDPDALNLPPSLVLVDGR